MTRWGDWDRAEWFCPVCGWGPYDQEEDACPNPHCEKHWSRLIPNEAAAEGQRRAALITLGYIQPGGHE